jgi:hypothetical protein
MSKFGTVQVGYGFECLKNNGKRYAGEIVKVAAYTKGTLVTICYGEPDAVKDYDGSWHNVTSPAYRSIYLEECAEWHTEEPAPY